MDRVIADSELLSHLISIDGMPSILYDLYLHYGLSMELFLKTLFKAELRTIPYQAIFRSITPNIRLVINYLDQYGGTFQPLIQKVQELIEKYQPGSNERKMKKVISKLTDYLEEHLISLMSPELIDYCNSVYRWLNHIELVAGGKILPNFLMFNLLIPKIQKQLVGVDTQQLVPVIKGLNGISMEPIAVPKTLEKYGRRYHDMIMRLWTLPCLSATYRHTKTLDNKVLESHLVQLNREIQGYREMNKIMYRAKSSSDMMARKGTGRPGRGHSGNRCNNCLRYFGLLSSESLSQILQEINGSGHFMVRWGIDGLAFLQITRATLISLGLTEPEIVNQILRFRDQVKKVAIQNVEELFQIPVSKWSLEDFQLYLLLSGLGKYRNIFRTAQKLMNGKVEDFQKMGITDPAELVKVVQCQNQLKKYF